jgi:hypothetical protein
MVLAVGVWVWVLVGFVVVVVGAAVLGGWLQRKGRDMERHRRN